MSVSKTEEKPNKSNAVLLAINHLLVLWWGSGNWIGDLSCPDGHRTLEERCFLILSPIIYEILSSLYGILNWGHQGEGLFIMAITSQQVCGQKQGQVQV